MINDKTTDKLRSNILQILFGIFALLSISLLVVVYIEQNQYFQEYENKIQDQVEKTVDFTFEETTKKYSFIIQRVAKQLNVAQYVHNNDREGLYKVLKDKFDQFKQETEYVHTLHFIKANGESFLRVHQKDKFGDPIINDRIMVQEIMRTQKTLVGYETGKYATVFRILIPIFYEDKFLGSLGIGIDPNYIMERIAKLIKQKGILFIQEDNLKLYKLDSKFDLTFNQFRIQTKIDDESLKMIQAFPKEYNLEKDLYFEYLNKKYLLYVVDVKNFKGDVHGKIVFINDITKEINKIENLQLYILLILLVFLLVAFVLIRYFIIKFGNKIDKFYKRIITQIQDNESYLQAVEDNSSNIIVTSKPDEKMIAANKRFFEFTRYKSFEEFKKEHECICDLFIERKGYLKKELDGVRWVKYIVDNPNIIHKAIMKKGDENRVFKVTASKIKIKDNVVFVSTFVDITEIEEIKNRLSYAINGTKDGLWDWDLQTDEVYFSPRWKEMLGYEPDEIPNILKTWDERVHPDDKEQALKDLEANQNKQTDTYENIHRLRHKDGSWVWILDRGQTIFDDGKAIRMVGFHTDITKRKEEENLIKLQAQRSEALLELPRLAEELDEREFVQKGQEITEDLTKSSIAFIHFVHEDEKNIELVAWSNRTLEHYCKVNKEDYGTHYPSHEAGIWANAMRTKKPFVVNDYPNFANKMGLPEGHAHLQRFISVPVIENGKVVMITGVGNKNEDYDSLDIETVQLISNDIWQAVQRHRHLEEIKQKDKMMLSQSRNAAMGEMISMIAHQWRQPLAVISMSANNVLADIELEMIEEKSLKDSCKEILYQTSELSKTIDDFKEFFKPIKEFETIAVKEVLNSAFKVIGTSLENNNVKVIEEINTTKEIQTYSRELMQVFLNIINNAKEVLLENKIPKKQIKIIIEDIENGIEIKFCDNAGGIPAEIIDKIFEPYFSTKEERTGTGLGLYMSKIIIEKHLGGILSVKNIDDGACFSIELLEFLPQNLEKKVD